MLPLKGTPNQNIVIIVTMNMSIKPMIANGIVFPMMNSIGLIGDTMICSMVPDSRSFTIDIDVSMTVIRETMNADNTGQENNSC